MNKRCIVVIFTVLIVTISLLNPLLSTEFQTANGQLSGSSNVTLSSTSEPIVISSNTDFKNQSWPGNGTADSPFILSNLVIEGDSCITISDTSSYFKIESCRLFGGHNGILLHNVSNSILNLNFINATSAIRITNSNNCIVMDNDLISGRLLIGSSSGCIIQNNSMTNSMELSYCSNISIYNHTLYGPDIGIHLINCYTINVVNNTLGRDFGWLLTLEYCINCSVFRNKLASFSDITALDYGGGNNTWDDGISQGNGWYNYNNTGNYSIPGDSGSVDRFPSIFIPPISIDFSPPIIEARIQWTIYDVCSLPFSLYFEANVSDYSGVASVRVLGFGEMEHSPTPTNPNRYVLSVAVGFTSQYYSYWAIDTLGHSSESGEGYISVGLYNCGTSTSETRNGDPLNYSIILGAGFFLIVLVPVALIYRFGKGKRNMHQPI